VRKAEPRVDLNRRARERLWDALRPGSGTQGLSSLRFVGAVGEGTEVPGRGGRGLWLVSALGRTIDPATVLCDLGTMRPAEWRRAFCNPWDDAADDGG